MMWDDGSSFAGGGPFGANDVVTRGVEVEMLLKENFLNEEDVDRVMIGEELYQFASLT